MFFLSDCTFNLQDKKTSYFQLGTKLLKQLLFVNQQTIFVREAKTDESVQEKKILWNIVLTFVFVVK